MSGVTKISVLAEIAKERKRQVEELGYTADEDDDLLGVTWTSMIAAHAGRVVAAFWWGDKKPSEARVMLVKLAALSVALVERLDRLTEEGHGDEWPE